VTIALAPCSDRKIGSSSEYAQCTAVIQMPKCNFWMCRDVEGEWESADSPVFLDRRAAQNAKLSAFLKKTQNDLLVYNSEIANQQKDLDTLRLDSQDKESTLFRHETESKDRTRQLGEIKMAIQNIYIRTRQRGPYPESNKQFLDAIQQRIIDYQAIVTGHDRPLAQFAVLKQPPPRQSPAMSHAMHVEDPGAPARGSVSVTKGTEAGGGGGAKTGSVGHGVGQAPCKSGKGNLDTSMSGSGAQLSMASVEGGKAHGASLTRAECK